MDIRVAVLIGKSVQSYLGRMKRIGHSRPRVESDALGVDQSLINQIGVLPGADSLLLGRH